MKLWTSGMDEAFDTGLTQWSDLIGDLAEKGEYLKLAVHLEEYVRPRGQGYADNRSHCTQDTDEP